MAEEFTINKAYAENYNKWRQKEELQKLKDKYGDVSDDDTGSSSSETEDEEAEALTSQIEKDWLRTLSALKSKDPKIYKKDFQFYDSKDDSVKETEKKTKQKPVFLKDYERKLILEKEGQFSEESDSDEDEIQDNTPGYYEEQEQIKKSFKSALDSEEDSDDTDLFSKRSKSKEEKEKEEEEYLEWLKGQKKDLKRDEQNYGIELESLKSYWNDPKLEDGEKFLRDYILNKGYLDKDSDRIPTYDEIVDDGEGFSEEETILDKQEEFERKYNFRFEEPDQEFIKSYPRTIADTVRRKDSKRAEKRKEIKERKKQEKLKRKEELKQLKNLKKREIADKIDKLKDTSGNPSFVISKEDLEEDFDPQKHDEMMQKYFEHDYYENEVEDKKPVFSDDEELDIEDWDKWEGEKGTEDDYSSNHGDSVEESQGFNMDADYDPNEEEVTTKRGKKRKSTFAKVIKKKKPVFDPAQKTFEEYFDEYYKLDYEDVAGDVPCRFKYRKVTANDYGLSTNEILKCREKELNAWASIKKMSQYRTEEEECIDLKIYQSKAKNENKKLRILTSLQEEKERQEKAEKIDTPQKKGKKRKAKPTHTVTSTDSDNLIQKSQKTNSVQDTQSNPESETKKLTNSDKVKKKKKKIKASSNSSLLSDSKDVKTPQSSDINKKLKLKNKKKKKQLALSQKNSKSEVNDKQSESFTETKVTKDGQSDKLGSKSKVNEKQSVETKSAQSNKLSSKSKNMSGGVKKKKKKNAKPVMSDERLLAYGINPKKFKYMKFNKLKGDKT